jgi:hypothetical protein
MSANSCHTLNPTLKQLGFQSKLNTAAAQRLPEAPLFTSELYMQV